MNRKKINYLVKWTMIALLLAVICGSVIAIYLQCINKGEGIRKHHLWIVFFLPFVGAFCTYLYERFQLIRAVGNDWLIAAAKGKDEQVSLVGVPVSMFGTIASQLFGASMGREDIATHIAGTLSLHVSSRLKLNRQDRRIVIMAAMASGFGATFGTPIAGSLFAMEVLKERTIQLYAVFPVFITSFFTTIVTRLFGISYHYYHLTEVPTLNFSFMLFLLISCVIFGLCGKIYHSSIQYLSQKLLQLLKHRVLVTFIGGVIVVSLVFLFHKTAFLGLSSQMQKEALTGSLTADSFLWKGLLTIISIATGFRGGSMTPIFDIGSSLGFTLGEISQQNAHFIASLGFIGVFSAATNTPLTCFILGIELFGSDGALYYFMVALFSFLFSSSFSLFKNQTLESDML